LGDVRIKVNRPDQVEDSMFHTENTVVKEFDRYVMDVFFSKIAELG
jgi:hypothetical protein